MNNAKQFRFLVKNSPPLQIPGVINAYHSLLAKKAGFKAIYLSGGGVSAGSLGMPDLGISNLSDLLIDINRITDVCNLPLLVDIDTGFGGTLNIQRTIKSLIKLNVAACHIEDQIDYKRCGHRPNKELVSIKTMQDRIKACLDAKTNDEFVIIARTDALANEGIEKTLERINRYIDVGADMIFLEAATELNEYTQIKSQIEVPILANITEFGVTPLFTKDELTKAGVDMILYPLSAFRSMNYAALKTYNAIINNGTQADMINFMQSRNELYDCLNYYEFEKKLNESL